MNTIDGMQNEKSFYSPYNEFEYNHDFEKIDYVILEYKYFYISM